MQPYMSTRCCNRPLWERTKTTEKKTCIPSQTQGGAFFMEFVKCTDQIHKLGEDFTLNFGNMPLIISQGWGRRSGEAGGEEGEDRDRGEDREGRTKLTADSLSDLLVGYRSKGWSTREREGERDSDRERYQLYLCDLILSWSAWWLLQVS